MVYRPLRYEQIMKAAESLDVRARRMFGGMGVYTGEKMFAFLVNNEVGFKLCEDDYVEALKMPGASPMRASKEAEPMREYVRMPKSVLDDAQRFQYWLEKSASYVARPKSPAIAS